MEVPSSEHEVSAAEHRLRLDRFLLKVRPELGRHAIARLLRGGGVLVQGRPRDARYFVKHGDRVEVRVAGMAERATGGAVVGPPRLLLQTPHLVAVGKPPGMATNPVGGRSDNLLAWVMGQLVRGSPGAGASAPPGHPPGVLHRLDREASGIVLFSLSPEAHRDLLRAFWRRRIRKTYLALVVGQIRDPIGRIDIALARDRSGRTRPCADGASALTEYRVLRSWRTRSLLEVQPVTGRTHQIRAHLAAIGHPVAGDLVYGTPARELEVPRLWLHALRIELPRFLAERLGAPQRMECPLWEDLDE